MTDSPSTAPFQVAFHKTTPFGRSVGVWLPDCHTFPDVIRDKRLTPLEQARAASMVPRRRIGWMGGRVALRTAMTAEGLSCGDIQATDRGAPDVPALVTASISHKDSIAVALVDRIHRGRVGIDIEDIAPPRPDIVRLVLCEPERAQVDAVPIPERWPEIVLRFSTKEALDKALDPFVRRYVSFHEAQVFPRPDGSSRVELFLKRGEGPFEVEAAWERWDAFVLSFVRVREVGCEPASP